MQSVEMCLSVMCRREYFATVSTHYVEICPSVYIFLCILEVCKYGWREYFAILRKQYVESRPSVVMRLCIREVCKYCRREYCAILSMQYVEIGFL